MPNRTKIKPYYSPEHKALRFKAEFTSNQGKYDCKIFESHIAASNWLGQKAREAARLPKAEPGVKYYDPYDPQPRRMRRPEDMEDI